MKRSANRLERKTTSEGMEDQGETAYSSWRTCLVLGFLKICVIGNNTDVCLFGTEWPAPKIEVVYFGHL